MRHLWFFFTLIIAAVWPAIAAAQSADAMAARERLRSCAIAENPACFEREALAHDASWSAQAYIAARLASRGARNEAEALFEQVLTEQTAHGPSSVSHYLSYYTSDIWILAERMRRAGFDDLAARARDELARMAVREAWDQRGIIQTCEPGNEDEDVFYIRMGGPTLELSIWIARVEHDLGYDTRAIAFTYNAADVTLFHYDVFEWLREANGILALYRLQDRQDIARDYVEYLLDIYVSHFDNCNRANDLVGFYDLNADLFSDEARSFLVDQLIDYGNRFEFNEYDANVWLQPPAQELLSDYDALAQLYEPHLGGIDPDDRFTWGRSFLDRAPDDDDPYPSTRYLGHLVSYGDTPNEERDRVFDRVQDARMENLATILGDASETELMHENAFSTLSVRTEIAFCDSDRENILRGLAIEGRYAQDFGDHLKTASAYFAIGEDHLAYQQILAEIERLPTTYAEKVAYFSDWAPEDIDHELTWARGLIAAAGMTGYALYRAPFDAGQYDFGYCRPGYGEYLPQF